MASDEQLNYYFKNNYQNKNRDLREARIKSLREMEELKRVQELRVDEFSRRLIKFPGHYSRTHGKNSGITEWNQLYERFERCSRCRISTQWTIPRCQSTSALPTSSNSWRNAKPFFGRAEPQRRAAKYLAHTWYIGKRFLKIQPASSSAPCPQEKWEPNTSSGSEMPVWTFIQKFSHPWWGRIFKESWCRPTATADFRSSFRQSPRHQRLLGAR